MKIPWHHFPARAATGAFILNSGIEKFSADEDTAAYLHQSASGTYPPLGRLSPQQFTRLLAAGETTLGTALLLPVVPSVAAGAGLAAFSSGLLGMYVNNPEFRKPGSIRPSPQGIPMAKDVWMLGIGVSLLVGDLLDRRTQGR